MLMVLLVGVALASVPLTGGRLRRLGEIRLRGTGVVLGALVVQVVIISIVAGDSSIARGLHMTTYVLVLGWLLANSGIPWRFTMLAGGVLNLVAIAANDGVMPASRSALSAAGISVGHGFENSTALNDASVAFLGDIFAVPSWLPLANVYSIGDVLIVLGAFLVIHVQTGTWVARLLMTITRRIPNLRSHRAQVA